MYGQYIGRGANSLSIVGRLSLIPERLFYCIYVTKIVEDCVCRNVCIGSFCTPKSIV